MSGWLSTRCARVRRDLVAWIDGELPLARAARISAHVPHCRACAAAADDVRVTILAQRELLQARLAVEHVDVDGLWQRFGRRLRATEPTPAHLLRLAWLWRPVLAVAVASLLLWLGSAALVEPAAVLISIGVKAPPSRLTQQPELFKDYAIIQELDVLERIDTADAVPADAATPADEG